MRKLHFQLSLLTIPLPFLRRMNLSIKYHFHEESLTALVQGSVKLVTFQ